MILLRFLGILILGLTFIFVTEDMETAEFLLVTSGLLLGVGFLTLWR
jgi:hypothetical protein